MAKVTAARRTACELLGDVRRRDARARDLLRESERMARIDDRDRAFATRLVLGVIGARGLLDARLDARMRGKCEPKVRDALRLSAYELLFLGTPASAAVSQGVELVRGIRPRAAGMANAVLRRVASEDVPKRAAAVDAVTSGTSPVDLHSPVSLHDLEWVSGYPAWLLDRMGSARVDVARAALEPAPVYVATNRARHDDEETFRLLAEKGLGPRASDLPGSFELDNPAGLSRSGLVEHADVVVADLSAQRVAHLVGVCPGERVLEVGRGRGTKTLLLESSALRAGGLTTLVGVDSVPFKTRVAAQRMDVAGLGGVVSCVTFDATRLGADDLPPELATEFDVVFVDAPCSGTGTLRRHPEIPWTLTPADVESLRGLQLRMLLAASARVAPGGRLCYATCSLLQEENDDVVGEFLRTSQGRAFAQEGEPLRTSPALGGPDGHFATCLRRVR
ncbi:MAG: hypothetical protein IKF14_02695 [Atopobiaceae bacterium]|nr:hypothetical protein [Atopobiaceae bacterium]